MEGNYAKVLTARRSKVFEVMYERLQEAVRVRQSETRNESNFTGIATPSVSEERLDVISNMIGYAADLERIV